MIETGEGHSVVAIQFCHPRRESLGGVRACPQVRRYYNGRAVSRLALTSLRLAGHGGCAAKRRCVYLCRGEEGYRSTYGYVVTVS